MAQHKAKSILLVDDDEDDILLFRETLRQINEHTTLLVLGNGNQLMTFLSETESLPELVLLDLQMPLKDGYESLREIRANSRFGAIKVLVLSTTGYIKNVARAYEYGADLYIQKPDSINDLKKIIEFLDRVDWPNFKRPALEHFVFPENN